MASTTSRERLKEKKSFLIRLGSLFSIFFILVVYFALQDFPSVEAERGPSTLRQEEQSRQPDKKSVNVQNPIIGKWLDKDKTDDIEFFGDGSLIGLGGQIKGKYRIVSGKVIEVELFNVPRPEARRSKWEIEMIGKDSMLLKLPSNNSLGFEVSRWNRVHARKRALEKSGRHRKTTRSSDPNTWVTKGSQIAAVSEAMVDKAYRYIVDNDLQALQVLLDTGLVIFMKEGLEVHIVDTKVWSGKVKIRVRGTTSELWTSTSSITKG